MTAPKRRRTNKTARDAGARHERAIADYLRDNIADHIDRRPRNGAKDRGDIGGVRAAHAGRVVIECKDTNKIMVGPFLREAETERGNDDALVGCVIAKRTGKGHPGDQVVIMTVDDLVALITGARPVRT